MYRTTFIRTTRLFSTTPAARKTATEKIKETGDLLNKKVGQTLAAGIEKGEHAAEAMKETMGMKTNQARQTAQEAKETAEQKANRMAASARKAKQGFEETHK